MSEPLVISALKTKRAELDGELRQAERRIVQLRVDLAAIDSALRVFDPTISPKVIRPIERRNRTARAFRHGAFSRIVMDVVRRSKEPLGCREIARQIASDHQLDVSETRALTALVNKVRNVLARPRMGLVSSRDQDTGAVLWRGE